ncbi:MAG: patatin-like phospholipase family protein [Legionellales bacterium]|nr:patatin-like phospholipase family protein [Legionellales bacterium]
MYSNSHLCTTAFERVAYVFQGGGALGAYQVGVYQALTEADYQPDWIAGISIGSINGAIIAGNPPEQRLNKLQEFWRRIAHQHVFLPPDNSIFRNYYNIFSAQQALLFGQPDFFSPRTVNPWWSYSTKPEELSYYDFSPLRQTLYELIDFDLLNQAKIKLSIGAVNIKTGRLIYFNNKKYDIYPEHIMASCALPPGFPAVIVGKDRYWDGGIFSNTPLSIILDSKTKLDTLCFMVDLFSGIGKLPTNMDEILERHKDISYSGQSRRMLKLFTDKQNLRRAIARLGEKLTPEQHDDPEIQKILNKGNPKTLHVAHLVYAAKDTDRFSKDYNFSSHAISDHMEAGYANAKALITQSPWYLAHPKDVGGLVYEAPLNPRMEPDDHE